MIEVLYGRPEEAPSGHLPADERCFAHVETLFNARMTVHDAIMGRFDNAGFEGRRTRVQDYYLRDRRTGWFKSASSAFKGLREVVSRLPAGHSPSLEIPAMPIIQVAPIEPVVRPEPAPVEEDEWACMTLTGG
jgi:hypothetical protein